MRRKLTAILAMLVAAVALPALAGEGHACCRKDAAKPGCMARTAGVERTAATLDNGVRITMTATDPAVVAKLQTMGGVGEGCCAGCPMRQEGVTRSVEKTANGVVITATSTDPATVKKLQEHATAMAGGQACCGGKAKAGCPRKGSPSTT